MGIAIDANKKEEYPIGKLGDFFCLEIFFHFDLSFS